MSEPAVSARMTLSTETARPGERLTYTLANTGERTISFGLPYRLERMQGDEWREVQLDMAFALPLLSLTAGQAREFSVDVPREAEPGRHRLVKEVREYPDEGPYREPLPAPIELTCEFEVGGGPGPERGKLV